VPPFHVPLMSIVVTNMALSKCVRVRNPLVMTERMSFQETVTFNRNPIRSRTFNCVASQRSGSRFDHWAHMTVTNTDGVFLIYCFH
jgi:hypothetical protein